MEEPERFGRYEVEGLLGSGGMGIVYLARDPLIGREVAIKAIRAHPGLQPEELEERQRRFEVEARSAGTLSHPNIVTVYDIGQEEDCSYLAMEYVRGEGLDEILGSDRFLTFKEISDLTLQICSALDYAHNKGVIHRDVKPANILISTEGRPKITDFGVAKLATTTITQSGAILGTPSYMSPEQVTGHRVTGASDQFSVAVILYEMFTGSVPFTGESPATILYKIAHEAPSRPVSVNERLPGGLDEVLMTALEKSPDSRYSSCSEFAQAITAALGAAPADVTVVPKPADTPEGAVDAGREEAGGEVIAPSGTGGDGTAGIGTATDETVLPSSGPQESLSPDASGTGGWQGYLRHLQRREVLVPAAVVGAVLVALVYGYDLGSSTVPSTRDLETAASGGATEGPATGPGASGAATFPAPRLPSPEDGSVASADRGDRTERRPTAAESGRDSRPAGEESRGQSRTPADQPVASIDSRDPGAVGRDAGESPGPNGPDGGLEAETAPSGEPENGGATETQPDARGTTEREPDVGGGIETQPDARGRSSSDRPAGTGEAGDPGDRAAAVADRVVPLTPDVRKPVLDTESVTFDVVELDLGALGITVDRVTIRCLVTETGEVADARVHRLVPPISDDLEEERRLIVDAIEKSAVRYWRFEPALKAGEPVPVWYTIALKFQP